MNFFLMNRKRERIFFEFYNLPTPDGILKSEFYHLIFEFENFHVISPAGC